MADTSYVVVGPKAWGHGDYQTDAVTKMVNNLPNRDGPYAPDGDTVELTVARVRGFEDVDWSGGIRAQKLLSRQVLAVDTDELYALKELVGQIEIDAETLLENGEAVDLDVAEN